MNINFGKHSEWSVEMLVLKDPNYVKWIMAQQNPSGRMPAVQQECRRLVNRFDRKPFVERCCSKGCDQWATRASVYKNNINPILWCDACDPYQMGADRGKLQILRTYGEALRHVVAHCKGNQGSSRSLIKAFAQAKGLPHRVGEKQAQAFFI